MEMKDLKPEVQRKILDTTLFELRFNLGNIDNEQVEFILGALADALDELDCEDTFGTEGWKHAFGIED